MSVFGTPSSVQHLAGVNQAERVNARRAEPAKNAKPDARRRPGDEVDIDVQSAQSAGAVEKLAGNTEEQTAEDRQSHDHYQAKPDEPRRPALDVQG
ncbi:MAG: hypothetical protein K2W85_11090 [Phycisphaerales bacterium]|nr:hypothetical protein [Phycisphaerales bacterium]